MLGKVVIVMICAAIIGVSAWWAIRHEPITPFWPEENAVGRSIEIEAEGTILHYQENRVWSENYFHDIMESQDEFRHVIIENFDQSLATYGEYDEQALGVNVEFDENRNMAVLKCDIEGAKSGNWFTFKWLLGPLGYPEFDFYDFQEFEKKLFWGGFVDNIQTKITISFPFKIDYCKAHVWPD
jgi:hypothetical protein